MTLHTLDQNWYLVQLKPNCGNIALRNLTRQGFLTFMPLEDVTRRVNDKFRSYTAPLFPGYAFISFGANQGLWRKVNSTTGVARLVSFGAGPVPVPASIISDLVARCDDRGKLLPPKALQPGDTVHMTQGPFSDFVATIETIAPDQRAWILIDLLGGLTRLSVSTRQFTAA